MTCVILAKFFFFFFTQAVQCCCANVHCMIVLFYTKFKILFLLLRRKKKKKTQEMKEEKPYIKKPPNAFMLFMKEQRPTIPPELWKQGSGVVNTILGKKVKVFPYLSPYYTYLHLKTKMKSSAMAYNDKTMYTFFIFSCSDIYNTSA